MATKCLRSTALGNSYNRHFRQVVLMWKIKSNLIRNQTFRDCIILLTMNTQYRIFVLFPQGGFLPLAHRRSRVHRGGLCCKCGSDRLIRSHREKLRHRTQFICIFLVSPVGFLCFLKQRADLPCIHISNSQVLCSLLYVLTCYLPGFVSELPKQANCILYIHSPEAPALFYFLSAVALLLACLCHARMQKMNDHLSLCYFLV